MYLKKLSIMLSIYYVMTVSTFGYSLSTDKAVYIPIVVDDITTMIGLMPAEVIYPANGSTINGALHMKFSKGSGVEKRLLKVYYANHTKQALSTWITSDSYSVSLPKDGKYIDVELHSYIADKYFIKKYRFKQSVGVSEIISPVNTRYLESGTLTLKWSSGYNVSHRYIKIGTTGYGASDIFKGYVSGGTKRVYGLPRDGEKIYVIFSSYIDGKWYHRFYSFYATDVKNQAKKFVLGYLLNNTTTMRKMAPQRVIDKLKTKDTLVRRYFRNIKTYYKLLYFHDYKAMVIAEMNDGKELKFYFSWDGVRWILDSVI